MAAGFVTQSMPAPSSAPDRLVPCPGCKRPAPYAATNRWRPFCCERCRMLDLGAWASERYRVVDATPVDAAPFDGDPPPTGQAGGRH